MLYIKKTFQECEHINLNDFHKGPVTHKETLPGDMFLLQFLTQTPQHSLSQLSLVHAVHGTRITINEQNHPSCPKATPAALATK